MRPRLKRPPVRNVDIGDLQDTFLVCAVATILVIRLQLWLTDYPQLGGGKLHIAHLLWGGLGMLIALILLLSYVGRSLRTPAAIVGGIGFGFFIDELGKFITSDNDYFYKPTAALIYVVFIVLFLATRAMRRRRGFTPREYLVNAMDLATEAARHDFDAHEKTRALAMIDHCDPNDPLAEPLREMLRRVDALPTRERRRVTRWALAVRAWYFRLVERPWFARFIGWVFAVWALGSGAAIVGLLLPNRHLSFINLCSVGAPLAAAVLVAIGIVQLERGDRMDAYRWFERGLLVQIFITQVFAFVASQFSAVLGLGIDMLLLATIRYMIRGERHLARATAVAAEPGREGSYTLA
ncbi:MAG: hypothetical protein M3155_07125 [Actinomycetota bacterium]|nr:hypothetical protein [Actinomycetota bacterium]